MKLSLAIIVKPSPSEAKLLDRCLSYVAPFVDEICITQAGEKAIKPVSKVIAKYKGRESFFKWTKNFAEARNYNFSQATGDWILWLDADDVLKGAENLKDVLYIAQHKDLIVMDYLYDFDKNGTCIVKHPKTRIIKRGSAEWVGSVHEDFEPKREVEAYFCRNIEVLHLTDEKRASQSIKRNLEIALNEEKERPKDPRTLWLLANAYWGNNMIEKAVEYFEKFIEKSYSDEEKYLAHLTLADLTKDELEPLKGLSLRPNYPNAYFKLAELKYEKGKYENAIELIEIGLQLPVPEMMIVNNPRDYDYNPLMLMLKCYWKLGKTAKAVSIVKELSLMFPKDKSIQEKQKLLEEELGEAINADTYLEEANKLKGEDLREFLDNLPSKVKSHPKICYFRNEHFVKEETSGKDLVYFCGYTDKIWNPDIAQEKGVGGSEEAVINLSKEFAKAGWNVTVYNNCGRGGEWEGVKYRPFWEYNVRDKQDVTLVWRSPKMVDYDIRGKVFIDLHDVVNGEEFTEERLKKIDRVFVKTNAHRVLFPNIPDEKIAIIPNGIDPSLFIKKRKKNPYLILNTSSPDRHLDATLDIFEELIRRQPEKPWKLAWYYGWDVYDEVHKQDDEMKAWKKAQMKRFDKLVAEGRAEGGYMIGHKEIAEKYLEAGIFLYPTNFYEIHCISAVKGQLAGCKMVTSDFAALKETVKTQCVHTDEQGERTFGDHQVDKYIDAILNWETEKVEITDNWEKVGKLWLESI